MTVLADQNRNLVLASPDTTNGVPDFRALTANDLASGIVEVSAASIVAQKNTGTSDTYTTPTFKLNANTLKVGDVFRVLVGNDGQSTNFYDFNVRFGGNGNVSDTSVMSLRGQNTSVFWAEFFAVVRANGASGVLCVSTPSTFVTNSGAPNNINLPAVETAIDTTQDNYLGFSFKQDPPTGNTHWQTAVVHKIR